MGGKKSWNANEYASRQHGGSWGYWRGSYQARSPDIRPVSVGSLATTRPRARIDRSPDLHLGLARQCKWYTQDGATSGFTASEPGKAPGVVGSVPARHERGAATRTGQICEGYGQAPHGPRAGDSEPGRCSRRTAKSGGTGRSGARTSATRYQDGPPLCGLVCRRCRQRCPGDFAPGNGGYGGRTQRPWPQTFQAPLQAVWAPPLVWTARMCRSQ